MTIKIRPKPKKMPVTEKLKAEFFMYLNGFCDGAAISQPVGTPIIMSVSIFQRTRFFKRTHPTYVHCVNYNKVVGRWLEEFVRNFKG